MYSGYIMMVNIDCPLTNLKPYEGFWVDFGSGLALVASALHTELAEPGEPRRPLGSRLY